MRMRWWLILAALPCLLSACQAISGLDNLEPTGTTMPMRNDGVKMPVAGCEASMDSGSSCVDPDEPVTGATPLLAACETDADCVTGSACFDGLCAQPCESDTDCAGGACRVARAGDKASAGTHACLTRCEITQLAACFKGQECARLYDSADPTKIDGDYCVVPTAECTTNNDRCEDTTWGTRRCKEGSDAADCECQAKSNVPEASCDLITSCGCAPATHCALSEVDGTRAVLRCEKDLLPVRARGEQCNQESECAPGYSCWRGLCEKYCLTNAECEGGECIGIRNPGEVPGVRVCSIPCTYSPEDGCALPARCIHAADQHDYCFIPRAPCPLTGNGICDESRNTRICLDGTDVADCRAHP
jgi:hypothetical protein